MNVSIPKDGLLTWPAIGLALILCGQPIGWGIRGFVSGGESPIYPTAIILLGFLLTVNWNNIVHLKFYIPPIFLIALVVFTLFPMGLFMLNVGSFFYKFAGFLFFICALTFAIASQKNKEFDRLPLAITIIGAISCLIPIIQIATLGIEAIMMQSGRLKMVGNDNALLFGQIGSATLLATLVTRNMKDYKRGYIWEVCLGFVVILSLSTVIMSGTRSAYLGLICALLLGFFIIRKSINYQKPRSSGVFFYGTMATIIILGLILIISSIDAELLENLLKRSSSRLFGALSLLSDSTHREPIDMSSMQRMGLIEETVNELNFFGHGVMAQSIAKHEHWYSHVAHLHAFYDLGVIGGVLFFSITILVPIKILMSKIRNITSTQLFLLMYFIFMTVHISLFHSTPYNWTYLLAILLIYLLYNRKTYI